MCGSAVMLTAILQPRCGARFVSGAVERAAQDGDGLGDGGPGGVGAAERVEHHEVVCDAVVTDGRNGDAGRAQPRRVSFSLIAYGGLAFASTNSWDAGSSTTGARVAVTDMCIPS